MGRQKPWAKKNQDTWRDSGRGPSWQLWQGSWSSTSPRQQQWSDQAIPATYDRTWVPQAAGAEPPSQGAPRVAMAPQQEPGEQGGLRQELQKSLTASKRCDTKIRKLLETKEMRQMQFKHYREQIKAAFAKQKAQFERDIQSFDEEIAVLKQQGEAAAAHMQDLAINGLPKKDAELGPNAADVAWEELMGAPSAEPQMMDFMKQAYAAALALQQNGGLAGASRQLGLGVMPPQLMERLVGCPTTGAMGPTGTAHEPTNAPGGTDQGFRVCTTGAAHRPPHVFGNGGGSGEDGALLPVAGCSFPFGDPGSTQSSAWLRFPSWERGNGRRFQCADQGGGQDHYDGPLSTGHLLDDDSEDDLANANERLHGQLRRKTVITDGSLGVGSQLV
ncbi:unnamed protein product, partial [Symbiodinium sp. CCMP2456]